MLPNQRPIVIDLVEMVFRDIFLPIDISNRRDIARIVDPPKWRQNMASPFYFVWTQHSNELVRITNI